MGVLKGAITPYPESTLKSVKVAIDMIRKAQPSKAEKSPSSTLERAITVIKEQRIHEGRPLGERLTSDSKPIAISGMTNDSMILDLQAPLKIAESTLAGRLSSTTTITISDTRFDGSITCDTLYVVDGSRISGEIKVRRLMVNGSRVTGTFSISEIMQKDQASEVCGSLS